MGVPCHLRACVPGFSGTGLNEVRAAQEAWARARVEELAAAGVEARLCRSRRGGVYVVYRGEAVGNAVA